MLPSTLTFDPTADEQRPRREFKSSHFPSFAMSSFTSFTQHECERVCMRVCVLPSAAFYYSTTSPLNTSRSCVCDPTGIDQEVTHARGMRSPPPSLLPAILHLVLFFFFSSSSLLPAPLLL